MLRYSEVSVPSHRGRGDEWADPWMRSKSPSGRKTGSGSRPSRRQSYSSGSSYSSSRSVDLRMVLCECDILLYSHSLSSISCSYCVPLPYHLLRNWIVRPLIKNYVSVKFPFCVLLHLEGHSHFLKSWKPL